MTWTAAALNTSPKEMLPTGSHLKFLPLLEAATSSLRPLKVVLPRNQISFLTLEDIITVPHLKTTQCFPFLYHASYL